MDIKKIIKMTSNPKLYEKGTAVMWTDDYISKQLLSCHLDPDINAASRKNELIDKTVQWIIHELGKKQPKVLDMGCGPGLYAERFAKLGYEVTGIDFSKNSIDYANKSAIKNNLDIKYICANYLEYEMVEKYDLIIMIFCDLGVLSVEERNKFFNKIYNSLNDGGIFIFDVFNENKIQNFKIEKTWEYSDEFWSDKPYICLSETIHYPENKLALDQHIVIDENNDFKIYRFWEHYFDASELKEELATLGFSSIKFFDNILIDNDSKLDNTVTFFKVNK